MTNEERTELHKALADQLHASLSHIAWWTYDSAVQIAGLVLSDGSPVGEKIRLLEAEGETLAANQCEGPMIGDEYGNFRCGKLLESHLSGGGEAGPPPELAYRDPNKVRAGDHEDLPAMSYFDAALTSADPYDDREGPWYDMKKVAEIEKRLGVTFPRKRG